jgi:hypothetical protein
MSLIYLMHFLLVFSKLNQAGVFLCTVLDHAVTQKIMLCNINASHELVV